MIAILCALASGAMLFLSTGLGDVWPLVFVAPLPVLWLAFGTAPRWQAAAASAAAYATGQSNLLIAYGDVLPPVAIAVALAVPAIVFACAVLLAREATHRLPAVLALFALPVAYTAAEFAMFAVSPDGTAGSIAYALVGEPLLIQTASLFGLWSLTFFVMLVPSAVALALHRPKARLPVLAVLTLVAGALLSFGADRLTESGPSTKVGLVTNDALLDAVFANDERSALGAVKAYDGVVRDLAAQGASVIVLPEKLAVLGMPWREAALEILAQAARDTNTTIVAGFDWRETDSSRLNAAVLFRPDEKRTAYYKQHLVQGLEAKFTAHSNGLLVNDGIGVAICKDMDFPSTVIKAAGAGATMLAVPAWDFRRDDFAHARMAILRGVEAGFPVVRAANQGLMTVSDAQGRIVASRPSSRQGFQTLVANASLGTGGTLYARIGDLFAWICAGLTLLLALLATTRARTGNSNR